MDHAPLSSTGRSEIDQLRADNNALHSMLIGLLLVLIVVSGTVFVFLLRQAHYAKQDLNMIGPSYTNARLQYDRSRAIIDDAVKKLQDFGRTNADFVPVLAKYNLLENASPTTSAPKGARAPAKK